MMFQTYLKKESTKEWKNRFVSVLDKHAPLKSKTIIGNNKPFITKTLRKAITQRSALKKQTILMIR